MSKTGTSIKTPEGSKRPIVSPPPFRAPMNALFVFSRTKTFLTIFIQIIRLLSATPYDTCSVAYAVIRVSRSIASHTYVHRINYRRDDRPIRARKVHKPVSSGNRAAIDKVGSLIIAPGCFRVDGQCNLSATTHTS